ncbi:MAG TPA: hypothetical protein PKK43_10610 [Spirochaetota bacterium]|nr:hypothetical protein [Spirochaetota bacterium]
MTKITGKEDITARAVHLGFSPIGGACLLSVMNRTDSGTLTMRSSECDGFESGYVSDPDPDVHTTSHDGITDKWRLHHTWLGRRCSAVLTLTMLQPTRFLMAHLQKNRG